MRVGVLLSSLPPFAKGICAMAILAMGGCASTPPRPPEVAAAGASILAAELAGARHDLSTSRYLALAGAQLRRARAALAGGDVRAARAWAMRSRADAEVARMMTLELQARRTAERSWEAVWQLEELRAPAPAAPPPAPAAPPPAPPERP